MLHKAIKVCQFTFLFNTKESLPFFPWLAFRFVLYLKQRNGQSKIWLLFSGEQNCKYFYGVSCYLRRQLCFTASTFMEEHWPLTFFLFRHEIIFYICMALQFRTLKFIRKKIFALHWMWDSLKWFFSWNLIWACILFLDSGQILW